MSEDAALRRANLAQVCKQRGWTAADLPDVMQWGRYTYWRDLLTDPRKSFGERVARRIEEHLKLGRGYLDDDHGSPTRSKATDTLPGTAPSAARGPFSPALMARLARCEPHELHTLETSLRALLGMPALGAAPEGLAARTSRSSEQPFKFHKPATEQKPVKALKRTRTAADSPASGSHTSKRK